MPECFKCGRAVLKLFVVALQELFVKYSWNSFPHSQVEQCVFMVLNDPPTQGEDKAGTTFCLTFPFYLPDVDTKQAHTCPINICVTSGF